MKSAIQKAAFITTAMILCYALYLSFYLGAFKSVKEEVVKVPEFKAVYLEHQGPYHEVLSTLESVEKWVRDQKMDGETCQKSFGEYLDDPAQVEATKLKSNLGCIVNHDFTNLPPGMKTKVVTSYDALKLTFEGSPAIGPMKVYPKAKDWMEKNRFPMPNKIFEIYNLNSNQQLTTEYYFELNKER